jgi:hypothetical protein
MWVNHMGISEDNSCSWKNVVRQITQQFQVLIYF